MGWLMKLAKTFRLLTARKADTDTVDAGKQVAAAVTAYHAALAENELDPDTSFSLCIVADSDGDADLGDPSCLIRICDRYADWYVLVNGTTASVIAFYAMPGEMGDNEGDEFAYSDTVADVFDSVEEPAPADRDARDAWLVKALTVEEQESPSEPGYVVICRSETQRYTLGVAYPHDELDSHGDFTDEVELEKAAWSFMRNVVAKGAGGVGTDHADGTDDAASVVESYIWRGPEWTVGAGDEQVVIKAGDWMVGAVWTPDSWTRVENGELTGWSIQGLALMDDDAEPPADE